MAKAFWSVVPAVLVDGTWGPSLPSLPGMSVVSPLDINRLTAGAAPADHIHLIVGGIALMSDQPGGNHEHFISNGVQVLRGTAAAHTHPDPGAPDFFLCYVRCSDAQFTTLLGAPHNVKPLVLVDVTEANGETIYGDMDNTQWSAGAPNDWQRPAFWQARALNLFGLALPAQVDRGKRLWLMLAGMFRARRDADDKPLRG